MNVEVAYFLLSCPYVANRWFLGLLLKIQWVFVKGANRDNYILKLLVSLVLSYRANLLWISP